MHNSMGHFSSKNPVNPKIVVNNIDPNDRPDNAENMPLQMEEKELGQPDESLEAITGWTINLDDRSILGIRGPDAKLFLHDIMTIDLDKMDEDENCRALYGLFINPKGRIFTDGFVTKPLLAGQYGDSMEYWVDVQSKHKDTLIDYFKTYALRKSIQIQDYSEELTVVSMLSENALPFKEGYVNQQIQDIFPTFDNPNFPGEQETDCLSYMDPRLNELGTRIICPKGSLDVEQSNKLFETLDIYEITRMSLGIAQGREELGGQLPLNYSMHMLNAISFNKGCYIGHELTQRTFQTGVLRKIALPFVIKQDKVLPKGDFKILDNVDPNFKYGHSDLSKDFIVSNEGVKVGKVVNNRYNVGIGLFDINKLEDVGHTVKHDGDESLHTLIWKPNWIKRFLPNRNSSDKSLTINPKEQLRQYRDSKQYIDQDEYAKMLREQYKKQSS